MRWEEMERFNKKMSARKAIKKTNNSAEMVDKRRKRSRMEDALEAEGRESAIRRA